MKRALPLVIFAALSVAALPVRSGDADTARPPVDFSRDVRPILAEKCLLCHGPDEADRAADLRLDVKQSVFDDRGGYAAIVPGAPEDSEVFLRITDAHDPMPPESADDALSADEIDVVRRWIEEGATWSEHWAYASPRRAPLPPAAEAGWVRDDIDAWVLARLRAEGMLPAMSASAETWLRRASFDLTGLPPTPEELDAFLDAVERDGDAAYERAADDLLASPRYGEHMARFWLDAARYGDTHGFHLDNERSLWRWREWVIDAFNANKPFDDFTVEQLAGDLLPDPTLDQLIATGFNRCNPTTGEGGLIAEEYLVKYAVDRVNTTATIFLGSTLGCAQCHDHKYDPFSQREYFELFAYFHSFDEDASDRNALAPPPSIAAPTAAQTARLAELEGELAAAEAALIEPIPALDAEQPAWEAEERAILAESWLPLVPKRAESRDGAVLTVLDDDSVLASGPNPDRDAYTIEAVIDAPAVGALHLEALPHASMQRGGVGRASNANIVLTGCVVEARPEGATEFEPVQLASVTADYMQDNYPVEGALDADNPENGWGVHKDELTPHQATFVLRDPLRLDGPTTLRVQLRFDSVHAKHALGRFRLSASTTGERPLRAFPWYSAGPFRADSFAAAYATDFGPEAGIELFSGEWKARLDLVDGESHTFAGDNSAIYLSRTLHASSARAVEIALGSDDGIKVWLNGEVVLDREVLRGLAPDQDRVTLDLRAGDNRLMLKVVNAGGGFGVHYAMQPERLFDVPFETARALRAAPEDRTETEREMLTRAFRAERWSEWPARAAARDAVVADRAAVEAAVPMTMITRDRAEPRETRVLHRGEYDQPLGDPVPPGVPAILPPLGADAAPNRLALARWLVDPSHPLTARVTVNRFWAQVFGRGLVETPEDFGTRGAFPSHPELLDMLSVDFVEGGWDVKGLMRRMVLSATYRQDSAVDEEAFTRDPGNRLLGRGTRHRLDGEQIRDAALFVSGLLVEDLGGPSVRPYQPAGLWKVVGYTSSNTANFMRDDGDALYRRGLYTFWKRTSPPPAMAIFDAPTREACVVQRARTNTPLQALALLNDVQLVEAARAFAARLLSEEPEDLARITCGFRAVTGRFPDAEEMEILARTLGGHRAAFADDPEGARALLAVGESRRGAEIAPGELAAWTLLCNLLLNLDETVTRG